MKVKSMTDSLTINMTYKIILYGLSYSIVVVLTITNIDVPIWLICIFYI